MTTKTMTRIAVGSALACASLSASYAAGHYVPGVEGGDSAAVPPKGTYYVAYLVNYAADRLKAPASSTSLPGSNTVTANALANRLVHITGTQILGADYGLEVIVPVLGVKADLGGIGAGSFSDSGVGDVYLGPLVLGWHGANWHTVAAAGLWLDNGHFDATSPASVGKGYKSTMLTGGVTFNLDDAKTWSVSVLSRYELNSKQKDTAFKYGDALTAEWGVAKDFGPQKVAVVGYLQKQMSADSGAGASTARSGKSALGLEFSNPVAALGGLLKVAAYQESGARAASAPETQGRTLRLTVVKPL